MTTGLTRCDTCGRIDPETEAWVNVSSKHGSYMEIRNGRKHIHGFSRDYCSSECFTAAMPIEWISWRDVQGQDATKVTRYEPKVGL